MVEPSGKPWWSVVSRTMTVTATPVLQVAADGRWETAEAVPVTGDPDAARSAIARAGRAAGNDIALEILWPAQAFVGVQWPAASWEQAAAAAGRALATSVPVPPSQPVETALLALLGGTPGIELELIELGAVNAWWSIGPELLWQRGAGRTTPTAESVLVSRPDLASCPHPVAVELGTTNPQPCWIGIHVSTASGPIHRLDPKALDNVLGSVE